MSLQKYKILVVDDDEFLLDMFALKFNKAGFEVMTATGGLVAIEKLKAGFEPDVLIIDIVMPSMDGFEVVEKVRKDGLAPNSIIILLTNQDLDQDKMRAKHLRVDRYIVKASMIPSEVLSETLAVLKERKK